MLVKRQKIGLRECNAVDGRDLHEFLCVGRIFPSWIKNRIQQYEFVEGEDFIISSTRLGNPNIFEKTYILSLDMAKELCMVERNDKGRQARRYFIACEKKLKAGPTTPLAALQAAVNQLVEQESRLSVLESENSSASLTSDQISHLDKLIYRKYREYGDVRFIGVLRGQIKKQFLQLSGGRTYKEIPRRNYEQACEFVSNWRPLGH